MPAGLAPTQPGWRRWLPWPLPALLGWALAWALWLGLAGVWRPWGVWLWLPLCSAVGALVALGLLGPAASRWRLALSGLGFPLSLAASGAAGVPAWAWLMPIGMLWLLYPLRAWRDAPMFPTPEAALDALAVYAPLPPRAAVLDAGCGLGDGLRALRRAYPEATWTGVEWSWAWRWGCAWRCPWARVRRGDLWRVDWSGFDLVYLFQRPESMTRALVKAQGELKPGAWLVSLEFPLPEVPAQAEIALPGRRVWVYRMGPDRSFCVHIGDNYTKNPA